MKNTVILFLLLITFFSCSKEKLNEIDTNPNSPLDVPIKQLMPSVITATPYLINGTELSWYCSIFSEQTAGTFLDMKNADNRISINSVLSENAWKQIYTSLLKDLNTIIKKGSIGGSEEGNWNYVGISQVLLAYTMTTISDIWGRVPYSEAFLGSENRKPKYDEQQFIYSEMQRMLDSAIVNLDKKSIEIPGNEDFLYKGDTDLWKKAAWSLKAKLYNHLSKIDPIGSAEKAISCMSTAFESEEDDLTFKNWGGTNDANHQNPWYRESRERGQLSVSKTIYDLMNGLKDPRMFFMFSLVNNDYSPAPNGSAKEDPSKSVYSKISPSVLYADAPLPLLTYEELKFIEAECYLRLGQKSYANFSYEIAVDKALKRLGVSTADYLKYTSQTAVFPGQDNLTTEHIIKQKYIASWPYQSIEAYLDWRRTGIPKMKNILGDPPRRFPYPQSEISTNAENVPKVLVTDGVWWDDASED